MFRRSFLHDTSMLVLASATAPSSTKLKPSHSIEESNSASPLNPKWGLVKERELFGRQADPYQTCAYIDGDANSPLTCASGKNCGWILSTPYLACCTTDAYGSFGNDCLPATTCLDYATNSLEATITYAVTTGYSYLCPSSFPVCGTAYVYGSDSYDTETYSYYVCDTTNVISSNLYGYVLSTGSVSSTVAQSLPVETSVSVSVFVTRTVIASATADDFSSTSIQSSSAPTTPGSTRTPSSEDDDKSPPTGAIVGGVVGGVAALALIAGFIAYRMIKKRKERSPSIPEISQFSDSSRAR